MFEVEPALRTRARYSHHEQAIKCIRTAAILSHREQPPHSALVSLTQGERVLGSASESSVIRKLMNSPSDTITDIHPAKALRRAFPCYACRASIVTTAVNAPGGGLAVIQVHIWVRCRHITSMSIAEGRRRVRRRLRRDCRPASDCSSASLREIRPVRHPGPVRNVGPQKGLFRRFSSLCEVGRKRQFAATGGASIAGQVFMTTSRPTALARSAAASSITPS